MSDGGCWRLQGLLEREGAVTRRLKVGFHQLHVTQRQSSHFLHISIEPAHYITRNVQGQAAPMPVAAAGDSWGLRERMGSEQDAERGFHQLHAR
jgi:hypothetical protein